MPAGLDPVPADQIAFIEQWIDDGCPEAEPPPTWRPTSAEPAASRYDDVWFQTPRLGWAVNSNGQILRTTDGGATWEEQFHDETLYLRCIGFASETRGWMGTLVPEANSSKPRTAVAAGNWSATCRSWRPHASAGCRW